MVRVLKFGGTSVSNSENIERVRSIVKTIEQQSKSLVVVVSALSGVTNALASAVKSTLEGEEDYKNPVREIEHRHFELIRNLFPIHNQSAIIGSVKQEINKIEVLLEGISLLSEATPKTMDKVLGYGEIMSSYIISEYFKNKGMDAILENSKAYIITNSDFGNARVDFDQTNRKLKKLFDKKSHKITVMPGFIACNSLGETTTLGRGGSDYTAAISARVVGASELQIWTDVSGIFTANPKLVRQAKPISKISYEEAMELSYFGAKVIYPPTLQPVMDGNIPVLIKNTFEPNAEGTLITSKGADTLNFVTGITHIESISLLTLEGSGMVGIIGTSKRFFGVLSNKNINVKLITQASSEHSICIAIDKKDAQKAKEIIDIEFAEEIRSSIIMPSQIRANQTIVAVVGEGMRNHQGLSGQIFSTLGRNNVNVVAIAQGSSERNISAVISEVDIEKAVNSLHESFFEEDIKQLNLFITGVGNVGKRLLEQIERQSTYVKDYFRINLRVIALSNTKKMYFSKNAIDLSNWHKTLEEKGEPADCNLFFEKVNKYNKRNSVFIDNTASPDIASIYNMYLKESISVVTCNKIACSSDYENYKELKRLSVSRHASLLFETNVGAALPIIDTLKNLMASGDKITEIHAVLSGSLNFVFNNFNEKNPFFEVVRQAQKEGFTEPDPRIDLSGIDVARKMLILMRESGYKMNIEDIQNIPFLPKKSLETDSIETFFKTLEAESKYFEKMYADARATNCRLKYVASFKDGKAKVGIQKVSQEHPFYNLEGKDNIVLFFTKRYSEQPLIVKGAGAGADVTASGIFADIMRVGNLN
ncbi:bifunctional aspartate kinase/homoserine dehydrogenase I [Elysia marginata]|uniref:Bifunctional aspartate kinase/homoserine dehydrogenase I n=1 Tax=Elysia marginata TaxID=1093978 RepID=A0AAV4GVS0_9GAST|nr:bifunctional aspartate kinase/homoserine dehydrogenase I [Elysia marginata]